MAGTMHDLDWLFALGVLFFLLSAWGIGANDVANSYATSVSSKSLTLIQAGCVRFFFVNACFARLFSSNKFSARRHY